MIVRRGEESAAGSIYDMSGGVGCFVHDWMIVLADGMAATARSGHSDWMFSWCMLYCV